MKKILLFIVLVLSINAKTLTYEVSTNYIMGDNDTKIEARKIALEQAKRIALEQAGTYMEVKTVVEKGKLTVDEIKSFGASVLKTKIKKEKYFFEGNSPILELLVESNIDMDILKQNIEQAKNNKNELQKRIKLQQENEKLLKQIETLKNDFNSREKRNELITQIEENNNKLIKKFKKGSLLQLSQKYENSTSSVLNTVDSSFFDFIINNLEVEIQNIDVTGNGDSTSNVSVKINWKLKNTDIVLSYLNKYFQIYDLQYHFTEIKKFSNMNDIGTIYIYNPRQNTKGIDKLRIYKKLIKKQILIVPNTLV